MKKIIVLVLIFAVLLAACAHPANNPGKGRGNATPTPDLTGPEPTSGPYPPDPFCYVDPIDGQVYCIP